MDSQSLTERLRLFSGGDREIADAVLREILPKLHEIALRALHREHRAHRVAPLSPTELINEVWLRSIRNARWEINNRDHFYAIAANAMRHAIVDFARNRLAQRRGRGTIPAPLQEDSYSDHRGSHDVEMIVQIGILMEQLQRKDPEIARVVDMHYFGGLTLNETAEITGLTFRQVRHRWDRGCAWLKDRL
jgi:RNA polymerase sigma-70 factor (ECF subfamily)